jgi:signal transduction histidine kinase
VVEAWPETRQWRPGPRRRIEKVFAKADRFPGPASLARLSGRIGLAGFAALVVVGFVTRSGHDPARDAVAGLVALGAAIPLFLFRPRFRLGYAAVATAGIVVLGNADAHDIVWFALVVLAAWCVLSGGIIVGVTYGCSTLLVFGAEWLWAVRDPGWAPWSAGLTFTVLATMLIRHEFVLVERLKVAQVDLAERSRTEERGRIARELHDVIAHGLTVSLLHVTAARLAVEHDPADAARALAEAERLGRQSLAEVRITMGLLRPPGAAGIAPPVPALEQVPRLVERLREAGADITFFVDGDLDALAATTGSTVYRIVQEALTNATKHAPGAEVSVRLVAVGPHLEVCVDSAGPPGHGSGMGLESMHERARALGGTCTAGPGGSGWLVHATLPVVANRAPGSS